jgi:predicted transcriptional regulator
MFKIKVKVYFLRSGMPLQVEVSENGLAMFFKDWQVKVLKVLWEKRPEGANSREVFYKVNELLSDSISRASVINFLNAMVDEEYLNYSERTGKGGHQRVYYAKYDETRFKENLVKSILAKFLEEYPDAMKGAIQRSV